MLREMTIFGANYPRFKLTVCCSIELFARPFVLFLFLLLSSQGFAETTHSGKQIGGPSSEWTASDSSEVNRQKFKWSVVGTLTHLYSLGIDYSINPDSIMEASWRHDRYRSYDDLSDRVVDLKDVALHYRQHFGGTFVAGVGLVHRTYQLNGEEWFGAETQYESRYFHIVDYERDRKFVLARLTLGNQWQWENLILGVDWIVADQLLHEYSSRIHTKAMGVPQNEGQRNTLTRAEASARRQTFGFKKTIDLLDPVVRIGWAF
jgi:hypothetical protein